MVISNPVVATVCAINASNITHVVATNINCIIFFIILAFHPKKKTFFFTVWKFRKQQSSRGLILLPDIQRTIDDQSSTRAPSTKNFPAVTLMKYEYPEVRLHYAYLLQRNIESLIYILFLFKNSC